MLDRHSWGVCLAIVAGIMAALASMSAKLAVTADVVRDLCSVFVLKSGGSKDLSLFCDSVSYLLRVCCFGGIFVFNALMWTFYTKSLQFCPSTVEASVTNTGSNFLATAVFGFSLFGEGFSLLWWIGSCFILAGMLFIHKGSQEDLSKDVNEFVTPVEYDEAKKVK